MTNRQKIDIYKNGVILYGFITIVGYLHICQEHELYEECALIVEAIVEINLVHNMEIPTEYGPNAIKKLTDFCTVHMGWSEERIYTYLAYEVPAYIERLKIDLNKTEL